MCVSLGKKFLISRHSLLLGQGGNLQHFGQNIVELKCYYHFHDKELYAKDNFINLTFNDAT
jgi:hypothetical protein